MKLSPWNIPIPSADEIEELRTDWAGMRADIAAVRGLLERLVELEETRA